MASLLLLLLLLLPIIALLLILTTITRPRPINIPIKNRHVLITGGSSGIGLALARRAAAEGARVSILARNPTRLQTARDEIRLATGVDPTVLTADARDFPAVAKAIDDAGPVDVLVCNHGIFLPHELETEDLEEIRLMLDVNLMGTFHLVKAALPAMKARARATGIPASIAIMSSQGGQVGVYGYTAYSASKFGLRGLAEALQHEVIADNIHVTMIFPPDTETPGFIEEAKRRPELSHIIAGGSSGMTVDEIAEISLNGIKSATFIVPCTFLGTLLAIATAGLSPQRSYLMAFIEVFSAGFLRFVGLCFQWNWYRTIEKWNERKNNATPQSSGILGQDEEYILRSEDDEIFNPGMRNFQSRDLYYKDPIGHIQGPFHRDVMIEWLEHGLQVRVDEGLFEPVLLKDIMTYFRTETTIPHPLGPISRPKGAVQLSSRGIMPPVAPDAPENARISEDVTQTTGLESSASESTEVRPSLECIPDTKIEEEATVRYGRKNRNPSP